MNHEPRLVAIALALGCATCTPNAVLSGHWVFVGGPGGAVVAGAPGAAPLASDQGKCFSKAELTQAFGPTCAQHEPEAAAAASPGDFTPGANPTVGEPVWYCSCPMVARVWLERCGTADTFKVTQVAVATQGACQ
ncbi:MAG TPA: hypothetical protein VGM56_13405 [Byssovorax sp.]